MSSFSVIIPVYQTEQYLERCLESLLRQSFFDFEVIMIDDGSTDHSYSICCEYQKKDKRFKVIHQENKGTSVARNKGIEQAQKEYIVFVDSDDYVDTDYLMSLDNVIEYNTDMCISTKYYLVKDGEINIYENASYEKCNICKQKQDLIRLFSSGETRFPQGVCLACYRRKFIIENSIRFNPVYIHGEDWDFAMQAVLKLNSCVWLEKPGYFYNKDNGKFTYRIGYSQIKNNYDIMKKWYYFFMQKENEEYKAWAELLSRDYNDFLLKGTDLTRKERKKIFSKDKESIAFYLGNSSKKRNLVMKLYLLLGYENLVPLIAYLVKLKNAI